MSKRKRLLTSEAVCMGHPDKVADQISDAILDAMLACDPYSRVAIETLVKTGMVIVAGEVTTDCYVEIQDIVRNAIKEVGYTDARYGFDYESCAVMVCIYRQAEDIAIGVNENGTKHKPLGAGDQGMMYGYACNETPEFMPAPIMFARRIVNKVAQVRKDGILKYLRPDGKTQVTVEYENDKPSRIHTVVLSVQHDADVDYRKMKHDLIEVVIRPSLPEELFNPEIIYHINPTGRFVQGGPSADCGLTGRKIMVDSYGSVARHGGGAFSGKDPTKVDRSAAYAARHAAKNIVAAGLADRCEVQLAYAIGVPHPVAVDVETFGTNKIPEEKIAKIILDTFDFSPKAIIENLKLRKPIYVKTARFGHFGIEDDDYTWEKLDKVEIIKKKANL